jgi:hypothetical protein
MEGYIRFPAFHFPGEIASECASRARSTSDATPTRGSFSKKQEKSNGHTKEKFLEEKIWSQIWTGGKQERGERRAPPKKGHTALGSGWQRRHR